MKRMTPKAACLALLIAMVGCDPASGPDGAAMGRVAVRLTDAPSDYLAEAWVCISQVYLQADEEPAEGEPEVEEDESARVVLWDRGEDPAQCVDLLLLQGVSVDITEAGGVEVPAGTYHQLRFVVDSARVVLAEGFTFDDGVTTEMDLIVPSGGQTGIKVQLVEPIQADPEVVTEIAVDADVEMNFQIQGNPETPAGIQGVLFTPHLVELP